MTFLPIVERELRVAARQRRTYISRAAVAGVAVIATMMMADTLNRYAALRGTGGKYLFSTLTTIIFYVSIFAGSAQSADSISREKREGTLGLLFLTDLRGYDIILGKLVAGALASFYSLLAAMPVLAIPLMLGGVTGTDFVNNMALLLTGLFYGHAVGLFISTNSREAQKAVTGSAAFLFLLILIVPLLHFAPGPEWLKSVLHVVAMCSPSFARIGGEHFWWSILLSNLFAFGCLAIASRVVVRIWQDKPVTNLGWRARWRQFMLGNEAFRRRMRSELMDRSAYLWLIGRERFRRAGMWIGMSLVVIITAIIHIIAEGFFTPPNKIEFIIIIFLFHVILKFAVSTEAARHLDVQRRNGELELLLSSTPVRNEDIFAAHWMHLRRLFTAPLFFIVATDLILLVLGCLQKDSDFGNMTANSAYAIAIVYGIGMLLYDVRCLYWIGLWCGLSSKRAGAAAGGAFSRVHGIPFAVMIFGRIPMALARMGGATGGLLSYLVVWALICILTNIILIIHAKNRLQIDLRAYVIAPGEGKVGLIDRLIQLFKRPATVK